MIWNTGGKCIRRAAIKRTAATTIPTAVREITRPIRLLVLATRYSVPAISETGFGETAWAFSLPVFRVRIIAKLTTR